MSRPQIVTAWMMGHYQARIDDNSLLNDFSLQDLDPRYVGELERRAFVAVSQIEGYDTTYKELKDSYITIHEQDELITELRKTIAGLQGVGVDE